ncbi:uncharacterized protein LOC106084800 [Stomoxys calcitrans]|nr:uncharacterized protein LOC106084800 [Stomoxys calcitrans]
MLVSTYQHDYIRPNNKRYEFDKDETLNENANKECQCIEEKSDLNKHQEAVEWTGIAPMGRLIDPRIIPTRLAPHQIEAMSPNDQGDCFKQQPNRFLKTIRNAYPDLYERLKAMPKDELNRRLQNDRMFTTYQIDFCNVNEYPEGIYESLKDEHETNKQNANKLSKIQGPCAEFRDNVMQEMDKETGDGRDIKSDNPCAKTYRPFNIAFADSKRFINSGSNSHWQSSGAFTKKVNFSEYMDAISKTGRVIMRKKLHHKRQ